MVGAPAMDTVLAIVGGVLLLGAYVWMCLAIRRRYRDEGPLL